VCSKLAVQATQEYRTSYVTVVREHKRWASRGNETRLDYVHIFSGRTSAGRSSVSSQPTVCTYGDSGYSKGEFLEIPFQGANITDDQAAFNKAMSQGRITVEWMFNKIKQLSSTLDFKTKLNIMQSPVGILYMAGTLLTNFATATTRIRHRSTSRAGCRRWGRSSPE